MVRYNNEHYTFVQIVIQEKGCNSEDFRSSLVFRDRQGTLWSIRGYGATPVEASQDVCTKYLSGDFDYHGLEVYIEAEDDKFDTKALLDKLGIEL